MSDLTVPDVAAELQVSVRTLLAALLLAPGLAAAACFVHPDTGRTHCTEAAACPTGTAIGPRGECAPAATSASCLGTDWGAYTPAATGILNLSAIEPHRARWTRVNAVVTVTGAVSVITLEPGAAAFHLAAPTVESFEDRHELSGVAASMYNARRMAVIGSTGSTTAGTARFFFEAGVADANDAIGYVYSYSMGGCGP